MFGTYRTFLALMVVAQHLGGIPTVGAYAVFGFYALSGYLMTFIMQQNYGYSRSGKYKYTINRFLRIYPMYWVSILFSLAVILILSEQVTREFHRAIALPANFSELFNNVALFFPFREEPRLTPPAWALTVEIFFYIGIGLGLSKYRKVVIGWFLVSASYHVVMYVMKFGWDHRYFTVFAASLPFSTGALIYHYRETIEHHPLYKKLDSYSYLPWLIAGLILLNWYIGNLLQMSKSLFFYTNFGLCVTMIISLKNKKSLPLISKKVDGWLGEFSFPIYLIHYQVGIIVITLFSLVEIEIVKRSLVLFFVATPLIFL
ncbi:acyltransferase [uncultured Paraglaciecola sp.]|uniref:acyltransferase family protein n=1 Tax=uncultured Paraglaciecola sp. TaxID=1765024 RepID=UPI00262F14D8|nr:acyltransferase [uncultured Paraglaciecola sp.]